MTSDDYKRLAELADELDQIETDAGGKCNWADVATVSSALRRAASVKAGEVVAKDEPDFAASIAEVVKEEGAGGAACGWKSCSGCHETNEGAETGWYPHSKIFGCFVGSGCSECGGLGVVWEYWSKDILDEMLTDDDPVAAPTASVGLREALEPMLQRIGDAICDVFDQMLKGKWCDDHGHDVMFNRAMIELKAVGYSIIDFRKDHLGYFTANQPDVEALAATTAERPGTVTSEPEPSTSDTPPAPQAVEAVEAVSVDEVARTMWRDGKMDEAEDRCDMDVCDLPQHHIVFAAARALLAKFKMEGR